MSTLRKIQTVTVMSVVAFIAIAVLVRAQLTRSFDETIMASLRNSADLNDPIGPRWFEEAAADITALGGYPILSLVAFGVLLILIAKRLFPAALFLAVSLLLGSLLSSGLKLFFARPRPDLVDHMDHTFTSSFPSAHAMVSTIFWFTFAAIAIRFIQDPRLRHMLLYFAAIIVILVGVSRIYLGVHWPTDVLAGWSCGVAWTGLCWLIAYRLQTKTEPKTDLGHSSI